MSTQHSTWIQLPLLLASTVALERSANQFLDSTSTLAQKLKVDEALIALLTAGAEWEELAVIVSSMIGCRYNLAYSNILGSSIANILGGLGLGLMFLPSGIEFDKSTRIYTAVQLFITLTSAFILSISSQLDHRICATIWFGMFLLYVGATLKLIWTGTLEAPEDSDAGSDTSSSSDGEANETSALLQSNTRTKGAARLLVILLGSVTIMSFSSYFITSSLMILSQKLNLTESTVGLTILSIITTIPEKFFAVIAGRRSQAGVIVASTAGSNIFLLTLCLGVIFSTSEANKVEIQIQELIIVTACSLALIFIVFILPSSSRWSGIILFLFYCIFLTYEFWNNRN